MNGEGMMQGPSAPWTVAAFAALLLCASCSMPGSIRNGWLDPTVVGSYGETKTLDVRTSLTLEDHGAHVLGATYPTAEDRELIYEEYPISAGDTLAIEIYELRDRQVPFQVQSQVSSTGFVNLPVLGQVDAVGLTPTQFEKKLRDRLIKRDILLDPDVTVQPLFLQKATYSIFGVGVSAANNAPLRAGTFPIRTPELRVLEAINQVGGLNEFVTEVYIFRQYEKPENRTSEAGDEGDAGSGAAPAKTGTPAAPDVPNASAVPSQPEPEVSAQAAKGDETAKVDPADAVLKDLMAAVDDSERADKNQAAKPEPPNQNAGADANAAKLQPDLSAPYIFVNGEFVQNPAYIPPAEAPGQTAPDAVVSDLPAPSVNWARLAGDTQYRILKLPADLLRRGDPEANIYVRPGDVIRIVSGEIGIYYVMGQVNRVGRYSFDSEEVTLKGAIAAAGGLSPLAWPDRCTIYRRIGRREQMIQVDLDRVFAGKDSDFVIRRGDIINVGTHPFAPFLQRIRGWTLPNPVSDVGYSFTYARNFADIDSFAVRQNPHNVDHSRFPYIFP